MKFTYEDNEYITLEDVEAMLNMKQSSIYTLVRFNKLPQPIKFEIRQAWKLSEIQKHVKNHKR